MKRGREGKGEKQRGKEGKRFSGVGSGMNFSSSFPHNFIIKKSWFIEVCTFHWVYSMYFPGLLQDGWVGWS